MAVTVTITVNYQYYGRPVYHKKSLKIPMGNPNPYIEEEQATQVFRKGRQFLLH
jgi:hypothetical protein